MRSACLTPVALAALLATAAPAAASGGLACWADDADVRFEAVAGVSHSAGDVFFSFEATVEALADGIPEDLRVVTIDRSGLTHHWLDGDEAKLKLHYERTEGDFATIDLVIEASAEDVDDGTYAGTYRLTIFGVPDSVGEGDEFWSSEGRVTCSAE